MVYPGNSTNCCVDFSFSLTTNAYIVLLVNRFVSAVGDNAFMAFRFEGVLDVSDYFARAAGCCIYIDLKYFHRT